MKRSEIEWLLPGVYQRTIRPGTPIFGLLEAMEALLTPCEEKLERVDSYFNPYRAPDRFVPMLARWVDLDRFLNEGLSEGGAGEGEAFSSGTGRLRELIANAAYLSKWRGSHRGLVRFLEIATGVEGFAITEQPPDAQGRPRAFHILVRAPQEAAQHRRLIERIVSMEKPAYVTYELEFTEG